MSINGWMKKQMWYIHTSQNTIHLQNEMKCVASYYMLEPQRHYGKWNNAGFSELSCCLGPPHHLSEHQFITRLLHFWFWFLVMYLGYMVLEDWEVHSTSKGKKVFYLAEFSTQVLMEVHLCKWRIYFVWLWQTCANEAFWVIQCVTSSCRTTWWDKTFSEIIISAVEAETYISKSDRAVFYCCAFWNAEQQSSKCLAGSALNGSWIGCSESILKIQLFTGFTFPLLYQNPSAGSTDDHLCHVLLQC